MTEHDPVNHPEHYTQYEHEVIELTEKLDFCLGNAVKYILRAPFKGNQIQDLEKARWYLNHKLEMLHPGESLPRASDDKLVASFKNPVLNILFEDGTGSVSRLYRAIILINDMIYKEDARITRGMLERSHTRVRELEMANENLRKQLLDVSTLYATVAAPAPVPATLEGEPVKHDLDERYRLSLRGMEVSEDGIIATGVDTMERSDD